MTVSRIGGSGVKLSPNYPARNATSSTSSSTLGAGPITLAGGEGMLIPSGQYTVMPGEYSQVQLIDPISGLWRNIAARPGVPRQVFSDGANYRLINLSGCAVGAYITNVGSAYTSAPTVTASSGSSAWTAVVGGAINTSVTITTAGAGWNYAPILVFDSPPSGGVQATAYCTISAGAINAVTVINQGAGYTSVPTITILPDPREASASTPGPTTASVLTAALTGSGTITAVVCTNHGTALTAVPTLAFSGGGGSSAAATAVMCFSATGFTVGNGGAVYGNAQPFLVTAAGGVVAGTAGAVVNPQLDRKLFVPRTAFITGTSEAGGAVTATGAVIQDGGLFQAVPTGFVTASGTSALPTTTAIVTITVGATVDTSFIYPT